MTPEQIDAATNAVVEVHAFLDQHGPGLLAGAIPGIGWWLMSRREQRRARRRAAVTAARQQRLERRQMARLSKAIDEAPLIPTQPGHDAELLAKCNQILDATNNRKETPEQ